MSTAPFDLVGGYWEADNARLAAVGGPVLTSPSWNNGQFTVTIQSDPGLRFEVLGSADVTLPLAQWTSLGTVANESGTVSFTDAAGGARRYYLAREAP